jgi:transcriptional regulator with XRE-family HTH domain
MRPERARSQGAILLSRVGLTQETIAAELGVTRVRVAQFQTGSHRPGPANRAIFKRVYGIPEVAWDDFAVPPPAIPASPPPPDEPWSLARRIERFQRILDKSLDELESSDAHATPYERAKVQKSLVGTIAELGKLTGESLLIDETKIIRLPRFRRIMAIISKALEPWPDAMRAVGEALAELEE